MKYLWLIFGSTIFCCIILTSMCIYCTIKKKKDYLLMDIIIPILLIAIIVCERDYIKDIIQQETTTICIEYVDYFSGSGGNYPGTRKMYFDDNGDEVILYAATLSQYFVEMEKGKIYEVTYFNNTKVIESYKLVS